MLNGPGAAAAVAAATAAAAAAIATLLPYLTGAFRSDGCCVARLRLADGAGAHVSAAAVPEREAGGGDVPGRAYRERDERLTLPAQLHSELHRYARGAAGLRQHGARVVDTAGKKREGVLGVYDSRSAKLAQSVLGNTINRVA
eukprot:9487688-Pyramimonas_sp.AAC.1